MRVEQITRERKRVACAGPGCGAVVVHVQLASYTPSGFKVYQFVPVGHPRPDGNRCTHLADMRAQAWNLRKHPK